MSFNFSKELSDRIKVYMDENSLTLTQLGEKLSSNLGLTSKTAIQQITSLNRGYSASFDPFYKKNFNNIKRAEKLARLLDAIGISEEDPFVLKVKEEYPDFKYPINISNV